MSDPPIGELLNAFEFEAVAKRKLGAAAYEEIAGGDRAAFDRITFRPRMMVNTTKLDLTLELFGAKMFAPILVAPIAEQKRYHPDGELAMARGAANAKAAVVISSRSSVPIEKIAAEAKATLWYQMYAEPDMIARAKDAVKRGCKAVCLTLPCDAEAIERVRDAAGVPLILKGVLRADEAQLGVQKGVQGIVVSNYNGQTYNAAASPMEVLPSIVDAVGGKAAILIDGGFRRGSDVLKALTMGARAVLLGRPVMWGLAAYGDAGVQRVLELIQTELARDMAMCGRPNLKSIDAGVVKVHRR